MQFTRHPWKRVGEGHNRTSGAVGVSGSQFVGLHIVNCLRGYNGATEGNSEPNET